MFFILPVQEIRIFMYICNMEASIKTICTNDLRHVLRPRPCDGHKGTFGHALLVAGSRGMAGAAILSAEACLRSGIGKLSILTDESNRIILQTTVPEAILKTDDLRNGHYDAVGLGPGLGADRISVSECLNAFRRPVVLDADALNLLAEDTALQVLIPEGSILTPHPKEAERLIGSSKPEEVSAFARQHHVHVVLKGHPSRICTPEGDIYVLNVGNAGMATAGSGDVLTGLITGLLAQGYSPLESALLGVWLHGTAGDFSADEMGQNCMLARDIIRFLPMAFRKLTADHRP